MTFRSRFKTYLSEPTLIFNAFLLFVFSAAWIRDLFYWFPKDAFGTSLNYWAFTDWLIDYSQGFIRRGLSGEIVRLVPACFPPLEFVAVLSWVLILAVVFGYVRLLGRSIKSFHPLILFGLLFLPSLFMFYLHDHNGIARKEVLGYVTLLLHLLVVEKSFPVWAGSSLPVGNPKRYIGWLIPITVILLPAIILIHEGNFLLFVPLNVMITLSVLQVNTMRGFARSAMWAALLYIPAAIAFVGVYLTGTPSYSTLFGICNPWAAAGAIREGTCFLPADKLSGSTLPGAFIPMQWTLAQAAEITRMIIFMNWKAWVVILPLLGVSLWYLIRQAVYAILLDRSEQSFYPDAAAKYTGLFFRKYFIVPLLFSLPIFLTAYDYGRWFTVLSINFTILAVSVNFPYLEYAFRKKDKKEASLAANSPSHLDKRWVFYGVSIIICILCLVIWLPHYCLFSCDILQSPLHLFSYTLIAH
jgi:hypothetical protein